MASKKNEPPSENRSLNVLIDVPEALKHYKDLDVLQRSPLTQLHITRSKLRDVPPSLRSSEHNMAHAIQALLQAAIKRVSKAEAKLLEDRYVKGIPHQEVAADTARSVNTLYNHLDNAAIKLAGVIVEMEQEFHAADGLRVNHLRTNLPLATYHQLFGVEHHIQTLVEALGQGEAHWERRPIGVVGLGGLGKTSVTREALIRWITRYGQSIHQLAWCHLSSKSLKLAHTSQVGDTILSHLLERLVEQIDPEMQAVIVAEKSLRRLKQLLREKQTLVVIDNVETRIEAQQVLRVIQELAPLCQMVITSRHQLDVPGIQVVELGELVREDAFALMHEHLQVNKLPALDEQTMGHIYDVVGGNPLALKLLVAQARRRRPTELLNMVQPSLTMQEIFDRIYNAVLELLSPNAIKTLIGLVSPPLDGTTWEALKTSTEFDDDTLDQALRELDSYSLLQASGLQQHYSLHQLTYRFLEHQLGLSRGEPDE